MDIARQLEAELERNQPPNIGVLKIASGNATKRLKARQDTRVATRATKNAEATIKQIATQQLQAEKARMQEWKKNVMVEVAHELQVMKAAQAEEMEAQRQSFQRELDMVKEKLVLSEAKTDTLEKEIKLLKSQKPAQGRRSAQTTPAANTSPTTSVSEPEGEEISQAQSHKNMSSTPAAPSSSKQPRIEKRNYAMVAASKPPQSPEQPWTQVKYGNRKQTANRTRPLLNEEQRGRRILFPRETSGQQKSEADLMLALNEALQKIGEEPHVRFCRVKYAQSGAISALLTEKADAGVLIPRRANLLIRAAKSVDTAVIGIEVLENWQRLKVHGMPLERYLGEGKMELLKREVESATGIELKTLPRWLISESRLREQQEANNKRGSAIVITVSGENEGKRLCASGLRFGGIVKVVEKYWESGPSSVCLTCCGIGHERMGKCGDQPPKCIICAGPHKVEDHRCGVNGCSKGIGKMCAHVLALCANCGGNHPANSTHCTLRHKAEVNARKEKTAKKTLEKDKATVDNREVEVEDQVTNPNLDPGMDVRTDNWAQSPGTGSPSQEYAESRDHTKDF